MSSDIPQEPKKKQKKVYYSARGGPRPKGADAVARANAAIPARTAMEIPLPRNTETHYLRGGTGNEWSYVVGDGVFERALEHDALRLQELGWKEVNHRIAKAGLRGGARIPRPKGEKSEKRDKLKLKTTALSFLTRRRGSSVSSKGSISPSSPASTSDTFEISETSLEQRLYELSIASTDDTQSLALSNFTVPTFLELLTEHSGSSRESVDAESTLSPLEETRSRTFSMSSMTSDDDSLASPPPPPTPIGRFSFVSPGLLVFKPGEAEPLVLESESADHATLAS